MRIVVEQAFVGPKVVTVCRSHEPPLLLVVYHAFVVACVLPQHEALRPVVLGVAHDLALLLRLVILQLR